MHGIYLQSTSEGKTWKVTDSKTREGLVSGWAVEGKRTDWGNGIGGFEFDLFGSRKVEVATTAKRATSAAKQKAIQAARAELIAQGLALAVEE